MDWLSWIILGLIALGGIAILIWKIIEVIKMTPDERKETIQQWLVSAVVAAEDAIKESGAGQKKMEMAMDYFKTNAPFAYKIMMRFTKDVSLQELIDKALEMVKANFEKSK